MFYTDPLTMYQLISEAYGDYLIENYPKSAIGLPLLFDTALNSRVLCFCHGLFSLDEKAVIEIQIIDLKTITILIETKRYGVIRKAFITITSITFTVSTLYTFHSRKLKSGIPQHGVYQERYDFVMASDLLQIGSYIKELHTV